MPQLTRLLSNERGSVLVGAFAFAIVMAIAGSGLLMIAGHGANLEDEQWKQELAFQAAESGLELGKRWIAQTTVFDAIGSNGNTAVSSPTLTINGMTVAVTVDTTRVIVHVTGQGLSTEPIETCLITRNSAAWPGVLVNSYITSDLSSIYFDGPAHFNHHITIGPERNVHFYNYPVSIHTATYTPYNYGTGPSGNNYDFGVEVQSLPGTGNEGSVLDQYFNNTFTHSQDQVSFAGGGVSGYINQPLLHDSRATTTLLFFYISGTTGWVRHYSGVGSPPYQDYQTNNTVFRLDQNNVNVLGEVAGNVTVVTDEGFEIYPVGDLYYAGTNFDQITYSDPLPSGMATYNNSYYYGLSGISHFLVLVSGGNIHFRDGYQQTIEPSDFNNGTLSNNYGQRRRIFCTAALIATNPDCGITWDLNGGYIDLNNYHYNLYVVGTRAVDRFFNYSARDVNGEADTTFRFYYDTRLQNPGFTPPGISGFKRVTAAGNELFLLSSHWRQQNIPGN